MLARLASVHACCFRYASRSLTCASLIGLRKCSANASHCDCSSIAIARLSVSRTVRPGSSASRTAALRAPAAEAQPAGMKHPASSTAASALFLTAEERADRIDRFDDVVHFAVDGG